VGTPDSFIVLMGLEITQDLLVESLCAGQFMDEDPLWQIYGR
jgi:hypothetical protein